MIRSATLSASKHGATLEPTTDARICFQDNREKPMRHEVIVNVLNKGQTAMGDFVACIQSSFFHFVGVTRATNWL